MPNELATKNDLVVKKKKAPEIGPLLAELAYKIVSQAIDADLATQMDVLKLLTPYYLGKEKTKKESDSENEASFAQLAASLKNVED